MSILPWKTLSSRLVYENPWTRLREDVAEMPNGKTTIYGVVECKPCVGVLPFIDADHVVMVRQYRYVFGEGQRWEMPTGGVKPDESLEEAARRETREEIGYDAADLQPLSTYYTSKAIMREVAHLYLGRNLSQVEAKPDETEFLEVGILPFDQVLAMVLASEIRDSMTVIAVLHAARQRGLV
ncbi:MAG: NUDIX hydrolase [Caldilineales bacterium]|nr:NUDIX hydrolase [Caldilineales bacterium]MCW5860150.1 NUDIX hydrolase [Caldilineales bacterium]